MGRHCSPQSMLLNDIDPANVYPVLMTRTPYSVGPYGLSNYKTRLGREPRFREE
jgi:hypothetical protein